jgi:hypothetical protein
MRTRDSIADPMDVQTCDQCGQPGGEILDFDADGEFHQGCHTKRFGTGQPFHPTHVTTGPVTFHTEGTHEDDPGEVRSAGTMVEISPQSLHGWNPRVVTIVAQDGTYAVVYRRSLRALQEDAPDAHLEAAYDDPFDLG